MNKQKVKALAIAALLAIVGTVAKQLMDNDPATNPDWNLIVPSVISNIGLLFARQNNVTSEEAGAVTK